MSRDREQGGTRVSLIVAGLKWRIIWGTYHSPTNHSITHQWRDSIERVPTRQRRACLAVTFFSGIRYSAWVTNPQTATQKQIRPLTIDRHLRGRSSVERSFDRSFRMLSECSFRTLERLKFNRSLFGCLGQFLMLQMVIVANRFQLETFKISKFQNQL